MTKQDRVTARRQTTGQRTARAIYPMGFRKLGSFFLVFMMVISGFMFVNYSTNAGGEDLTAVPLPASWSADFTPEDSAWDSDASNCIVVGKDSTGQTGAWSYSSDTWNSLTPNAAMSRTLHVGTGAGNYSTAIQAAVDATIPGDTVFVWPGTYAESVSVSKAIDIVGYDRSSTFIDVASISGHGFNVTSDWVNISGFTVKNAASPYNGIYLANNEHCSITDCSLDSNFFGIMLYMSNWNNISYNIISNHAWGMHIYSGQGNTVFGNTVIGSTTTGILLQSTDNNVLKGNSLSSNYNAIIFEEGSDGNLVQENTVSGNTNDGIFISESSGNTLKGNNVYSNGYYGIAISDSPNNVIRGNTCEGNNRGFYMIGGASSGNQIYQNNFLYATSTVVYDGYLNINSWHMGDPATGGKGGNYYYGYSGQDRGDGIGTSTYSIGSGGSTDLYPWMMPDCWTPFFEKVVDKNALSKMVNLDTKNEQKMPSMAIGPDGSINVVWEDRRTTSYDIYFAKSTDGGKTFLFNTKISDTTGLTDELTPSIAMDGAGAIYVVWQDKRADANGDIYFSKSTDGGLTFSPNFQLTTAGPQGWPSVAVFGTNVYVVWHHYSGSNYDIYFKKSTNGGSSWNASVRVDHSALTGDQTYPSMALDSAGNIYIVWHDNRGGNYDIYFTKSIDAGGNFTSPDVPVNPEVRNDQLYPRIAVNSNGIHVVWQDYATSVLYPTINYTKSTNLGSSFLISGKKLTTAINTVNTAPTITLAPSGRIFVAWQNNSNVYLSWSVNNGNTFLKERLFTREIQNRQNSVIAVDASGRLFGSWHTTAYDVFCIEYTGRYLSIQPAINAAPNGGTVRVKPATYVETALVNKTLNLIGEDRNTTIIDAGGASYPVDITASQVNVSGFTIQNPSAANGRCVRAMNMTVQVESTRLSDLTMISPHTGIAIYSDLGNHVIENCQITAMSAINFEGVMPNNLIMNCTMQWQSGAWGYGIYFLATTGNIVDNNSITGFINEGVYFESSGGNTFRNNRFESNNYAIYIDGGTGNLFYHNNIVGSTHLEPVYTGANNYFDNGYPDGGNYWSDYIGADAMRDAGQNVPGSDGMGDTLYSNMEGTVCPDNYPWMAENGWLLDYPVIPKLNAVAWDNVGERFWLCGETGGESSIYHVLPAETSYMAPLAGAPPYSFTAIASDYYGNILAGGNNLDALYYYSITLGSWNAVTESGTGSMMGWNVTGITFNTNDGRFYIVGNVANQDKAVAFFTDVTPLSWIGAQCYLDTSVFMNTPGQPGLRAIEWNDGMNYGLAVGSGVYRVEPYDGNALDELYWTQVQAPAADRTYYDVSWDAWGNVDTGLPAWSRACVVGYIKTGVDEYGTFWQYDDSDSLLHLRHTNPTAGTSYRTGTVMPPSSPPWLFVFGPSGSWMIEIPDGGTATDVPKIHSVQIYKSSDVTRTNLLNRQVDADSTYTFLVEYSYVVENIDRWDSSRISVMAWYDEGKIGSGSASEGSWATEYNRTKQFCLNYSMATKTYQTYYPQPLNGQSEFHIDSVWEDPNVYNGAEFRHRIMVNATFGPQTLATSGFMNSAVNTWDKNMAFNNPNTWDLSVYLHDPVDPSAYNYSYEEFGVKESASIYSVGNPGGSSPPGAISYQLANTCLIYYSVNTAYVVNISVSDLHLNGNPADPNMIPADHLMIRNIHSLAPGNSEISGITAFSGPGVALYIWNGAMYTTISAPMNGTQSAGPGYSDYNVGFIPNNFEATEIEWWVTVPVGLPEGIYRASITLSIGN